MKTYSKRVMILIVLIFGFQGIEAQGDQCLWDTIKNELIAGSDDVVKHFEDNMENAYDAWRILYKADQSANRLDVDNLKEVSEYAKRSEKGSNDIITEIEISGGYTSWRTIALGADTNKKLYLEARLINEKYYEEDWTDELFVSKMHDFVKDSHLSDAIKSEILKINEVRSLSNIVLRGGEDIFVLGSSSNSSIIEYLQTLIVNRAASKIVDDKSFKAALSEVEKVMKLPSVTATEITSGSGGLGRIFTGNYEGNSAIFKFDSATDYDVVEEMELVLKGLEPYGGAKLYGRVRVQDDNGVWREAVAMEKIEGKDLFSLNSSMSRNEPLSIQVTDVHLKAIDDIEKKLTDNGDFLHETNLGDFMLTNDPDRPIVMLDMFVSKESRPSRGLLDTRNEHVRNTISKLVENSKQ